MIPRILGMRGQWKRNAKENKRLEEAGITDEVIDAAVSGFITEVSISEITFTKNKIIFVRIGS